MTYTSDLIDMICPKCEGKGKLDKKTECDLCAGWCYVPLAIYEQYEKEKKDDGSMC